MKRGNKKKSNTNKMLGINNKKESVQLICCYKFQWTFSFFSFSCSDGWMDVGEFKSFLTFEEARNRVNGISFSSLGGRG